MSIPMLRGIKAFHEFFDRALTAAYKHTIRIIDPDFALQQDPESWEKFWRDPTITQAVKQRCHTVAGVRWQIEPASDNPVDVLAAQIVEAALKGICGFTESRFLLAFAIFRGRSYAFIEGKRAWKSLNGTRVMNWWLPNRLRDLDKRRVQFVPRVNVGQDGKPIVTVDEEVWSVARERFEKVPPEEQRLFIRIVYSDEESRLGYGRGLMEAIWFSWWAKQIIWKEGLQGLERWAQGIVVGVMDEDRAASTAKTNEKIRDDFLEALHAMRAKHVFVHGSKEKIEVVTGGAEGHEIVMSMLKYVDERLMGLILGSVLPFGIGEGVGSQARAEVETEISGQLITFDRLKLDEDLTKSLLDLFWRLNRAQLAAIGLGTAAMPVFRTIDPPKKKDPVQRANVVSTLLSAGVALKEEEVYAEFGFTPPGPQDRVVRSPPPVLSPPGIPGQGGGFNPFNNA